MTIDGLELFEVRPTFASPPELAANRIAQGIEVSEARRIGFFIGQKPNHVLSHHYVLREDEIETVENFFNARSGKWQSFLVPSYHSELGCGETNVTNSTSGSANLYVDWCDYANNYGPTDGLLGRYVFILWDDGTFFASKVSGVGASVANVHDRLTLATNLPQDVLVSNPPLIGFIYHVRFATDELALEYEGPSNASTDLSFIEITLATPPADV